MKMKKLLWTVFFFHTQLCAIYGTTFSYSGTTDLTTTSLYWSSPVVARIMDTDSSSFNCVSSSQDYVTYSVFNITVPTGFIHLEGFFDEYYSYGAAIYLFDSRNYPSYFDPAYGSSCIGFKAGLTPSMVDSFGSPFYDEYLYLASGTYYVVVTSYFSGYGGYFVVNIETALNSANINFGTSAFWNVPYPDSTQSSCSQTDAIANFASWTLNGYQGNYDIVVISNSSSATLSLNLYKGDFLNSQSSPYNPCFSSSSVNLITSTQNSALLSAYAYYPSAMYKVPLQSSQTYSIVVSDSQSSSNSLIVGMFMRPTKIVSINSTQSPSWYGPDIPGYSSDTQCMQNTATTRYNPVYFKASSSIYVLDTGRGGAFDSAIVLYRGNWTSTQGVCTSNFLLAADTGDGIPYAVHLTPNQWYTVVLTQYSQYSGDGDVLLYLATGQQITSDPVTTESMTTTGTWPSDDPYPTSGSSGSSGSDSGSNGNNNLQILWILPVSLFIVAVAGITALVIYLRRRTALLNTQQHGTPMSSNYRHLEEEGAPATDSAGNPLPPLLFNPQTTTLSPPLDSKETYHPPAIQPSSSTSFDNSEPFV